MKRKKLKIVSFSDFRKNKLNENVEEFVTSTMSEEDFTSSIDSWRDRAFVNGDVLLTKAREDSFKGDLKAVKSKKSGRVVLIYRPSINIGSMMHAATESAEPTGVYYYIFIDENEFDEYGEPEDGTEIGYSKLPVYKIDQLVDEHDMDAVDKLSYTRGDYEKIAHARVKFWEGEEGMEIVELTDGDKSINPEDIKLISPSL